MNISGYFWLFWDSKYINKEYPQCFDSENVGKCGTLESPFFPYGAYSLYFFKILSTQYFLLLNMKENMLKNNYFWGSIDSQIQSSSQQLWVSIRWNTLPNFLGCTVPLSFQLEDFEHGFLIRVVYDDLAPLSITYIYSLIPQHSKCLTQVATVWAVILFSSFRLHLNCPLWVICHSNEYEK